MDFHPDPSWEMIHFENNFSTTWLEPPTSNWFFCSVFVPPQTISGSISYMDVPLLGYPVSCSVAKAHLDHCDGTLQSQTGHEHVSRYKHV